MIVYKCDICKKKVDKIETEILYSRSFDYCENCKKKANKMIKAMEYSMDFYGNQYKIRLKEVEERIIRKRNK